MLKMFVVEMRGGMRRVCVLGMLGVAWFFVGVGKVFGRPYLNYQGKQSARERIVRAAACEQPTSQVDLNINNVRARLLNGGDKWWDLVGNAQYEVPKGSDRHAMFAGAIWIGGFDAGGTLRLAAQTYRQTGIDFWSGPIRPDGSVDRELCLAWDRHWIVYRRDIDLLIQDYAVDSVINNPIPLSIREWPAVGNPNISLDDEFIARPVGLAPFVDVDGDGLYNPAKGDYPDVPGDMAVWWVYNDVGDIHTESGAQAIGIEIQALAFAFQTTDEVNDMTFYKYTLVYHGTIPLDSTYIALWVDPDLGCWRNDYVGCDTVLDLGYVYNGTIDNDCETPGYAAIGLYGALAGTDFFRGPWSPDDSAYLGMTAFIYFNNDFTVTGNPETGIHFYNYMSCSWKDGTPVTVGGTGYGGNQPTCFMYPDDPSDPAGWSECTVGADPFDRRYVMSSGPFRLEPGAVNDITIAAIWVNDPNYSLCGALTYLKDADKKAQALFDMNFQLLDGPEAPNMTIRELDRELILTLWNPPGSNNEHEDFKVVDRINLPQIIQLGSADSFYRFEGYLIYQLKDASVSVRELDDPSRARLIAQVDIENGVSRVVNWTYDRELRAWIPEVKVEGEDAGIRHTFRVTTDAFATGEVRRLVNYKPYYFMVIAYAYNNFKDFNPADSILGQPIQFLPGRKNVRVYVGIPHKPGADAFGTVLNSRYGQSPQIALLEGGGGGYRVLRADASSEAELAQRGIAQPFRYAPGEAPILVQVIDPLTVVGSVYRLYMRPALFALRGLYSMNLQDGDTLWYLQDVQSGEIVYVERLRLDSLAPGQYDTFTLSLRWNEYVFTERGFSITMKMGEPLFNQLLVGQGLLEMSIEFADAAKQYLAGIEDQDDNVFIWTGAGGTVVDALNWIRSGNRLGDDQESWDYVALSVADTLFLDPQEVFEKQGLGWWAPYILVNAYPEGPRMAPAFFVPNDPDYSFNNLTGLMRFYKRHAREWINNLRSVELVITPDKSKWSEAPVIELGVDPNMTEGNVKRFALRAHDGLERDGTYNPGRQGWGWFPGYAIDLETGQRLAILYGENSMLAEDNGRDMVWNPSPNVRTRDGLRAGGEHYVYILNQPYSFRTALYTILANRAPGWDTLVASWVMWVGAPIAQQPELWRSVAEGLVPVEARIRLLVRTPFRYDTTRKVYNGGFPVYEFSLEGLEPQTGVTEVAKSFLDSIRVVPNPYYAYSAYERTRLENHVKITNLPPQAEITIYSIDGTVIRRLRYNQEGTSTLGSDGVTGSVVWDLRNEAGIPISSGLYLIHVQVPNVGETIVKFMAIMRPVDLSTF